MFIFKWFAQFFSRNNAEVQHSFTQEFHSDFELAEDLPLTLTRESGPQAELT